LCSRPAPQEQRDAFFETVRQQGSAAAFAAFTPAPTWKQKIKPYLRFFLRKIRG